MAFQLATNLEMGAKIPLDTRAVVATTGERNAITQVYPGLTVYVTGENKYYYYDTNNSWIEFGSSQNLSNLVYTTGNQTVSGAKLFSSGNGGYLKSELIYTNSPANLRLSDDPGNIASLPLSFSYLNSTSPFETTSANANTTGYRIFWNFTNNNKQELSRHIRTQMATFQTGLNPLFGPWVTVAQNVQNSTGIIITGFPNVNANPKVLFSNYPLEDRLAHIEKNGVFSLLPEERMGIGVHNPSEKLHVVGNLRLDGVLQSSLRPIVNGTGVLLQGEGGEGSLTNVVFTTGDQTISGTKAFALRPTVNGVGILLSGDLNQNLYSNYFPYLGAWFTTNSALPHGLHIAASKNGYDWNILTSRPYSGGGSVNTNELRDPSIVQLDNKWAIAFTENPFASDPYNRSSDNSGFFGILQSTNLAEWSYSRVSLSGLLSNIGVTDYNRLWAPEWFKEDNGNLYLTFSINRTGWGNHNRGHMVYIVQATDYNLTGWTNLRRMSGSAFPFFPPNSTDISSGIYDMFIEKTGNIYYGAYWDQKNIETRLASSTNLFTGWTVIASGKSWYGNNFPTYTSFTDGSYKEGSCIRYFDGKWRLWVSDVLGEKSGIYSEGLTPTGMSFVSLTNAGNYRLEHGTIIKSNDIANMIYYSGLVNQYSNQRISGIKNFVLRPTVNGTGVLLIGEAAQVDLSNYATVTNLASTGSTLQARINSLSGAAVQSNGTITRMIRLTQAQYNALSPKDSTTFYVIVG